MGQGVMCPFPPLFQQVRACSVCLPSIFHALISNYGVFSMAAKCEMRIVRPIISLNSVGIAPWPLSQAMSWTHRALCLVMGSPAFSYAPCGMPLPFQIPSRFVWTTARFTIITNTSTEQIMCFSVSVCMWAWLVAYSVFFFFWTGKPWYNGLRVGLVWKLCSRNVIFQIMPAILPQICSLSMIVLHLLLYWQLEYLIYTARLVRLEWCWNVYLQ